MEKYIEYIKSAYIKFRTKVYYENTLIYLKKKFYEEGMDEQKVIDKVFNLLGTYDHNKDLFKKKLNEEINILIYPKKVVEQNKNTNDDNIENTKYCNKYNSISVVANFQEVQVVCKTNKHTATNVVEQHNKCHPQNLVVVFDGVPHLLYGNLFVLFHLVAWTFLDQKYHHNLHCYKDNRNCNGNPTERLLNVTWVKEGNTTLCCKCANACKNYCKHCNGVALFLFGR